MLFDELSTEAQEVARHMIQFCIEQGYCMGMDEGMCTHEVPHPFRAELEMYTRNNFV